MLIIPSIDLQNGQCVSLMQGKIEKETIFSRDPVFIARLFQAQGAKCIHVVDLDGAFTGGPQNFAIVKKMIKNIDIPVQLGGGIRSFKIVKRFLERGVQKVILGTAAVNNVKLVKSSTDKYGERILISIDAQRGKVAIGGWKDRTSITPEQLAKEMENLGVKGMIFTSILKGGMLKGPDLNGIKSLARAIKIPLIAAGGITKLKDIEKIKSLEKYGVSGIIIGKALYTQDIKLEEAIRLYQE